METPFLHLYGFHLRVHCLKRGTFLDFSLCRRLCRWFFIAIEILERVANAQLAREWFREEGRCLLTAQNGLLSTPRGGRCLLRALNPCFDTKPPTHSAKMGFSEVEQKQKSQPDAFSTCCFKMQAACSCSSSKNAAGLSLLDGSFNVDIVIVQKRIPKNTYCEISGVNVCLKIHILDKGENQG